MNPTGHPDPFAPPALPDTGAVLGTLVTVLVAVLLLATAVASVRIWWSYRLARYHSRTGTSLHILAPPEVDPASATAFFTHLAATATPWWKRLILGQPHVVFEYAWHGPRLDIRVIVPATASERLVANAIRGAWPAATVTTTTPTIPALPDNRAMALAGALRLGTGDATALATETTVDPLRPLLSAMTGLSTHEHAVVQIAARPAARSRISRLRRSVHTPPKASTWGAALCDLIQSGPTTSHRPGNRTVITDPWQRRLQAHTLERSSGAMLEVAVRYAIATTRTGDTDITRARLRGLADQIATALSVHSGAEPIRRTRQPGTLHAIEHRSMRAGKLLTCVETAALAHLPTDEIVPQLARAGARLVPAPVDIPRGGRGTKTLGTAAAGGHKVAVAVADTRHHMHVVGSTGVGKSTLLLNLILSDIHARRGVVVVDPKGDLVGDVLDRLDPEELGDRLVVIDPDNPNPPGLNPLSGDDPDLVVDHLVGICRRIFERHWGPRADDVLRSALLTLLRKPGATLTHLPSLLSKKVFRAPVVAEIDDPAGLGGFWEWYDSLAPGLQAQVIGPVLSRIRALMSRQFVRATLGAPTTSFDMTKILDGGVLLARLPKGQLGDDTSSLMGSIIVAKVWQAATMRTTLPETDRRDASLYLDEAHNFLTLPRSLDDVLAEARGYHLSMVLAHQHMAQLPRELQFAISANARNKIYFTASPEDARLLARHTIPHLTEHDLAHLDAYTAAARLVAGGREQPTFTLATNPPPPAIRDHRNRTPKAKHRTPGERPDQSGDQS